jgi:hypothetical protein
MSQVKVFAFAIALVAASAATVRADDAAKTDPPPPTNVAIQVSPGDSWTYDVRDDVTGDLKGSVAFQVMKTTDAEIVAHTVRHKQATNADAASTEIFDARWRLKDNGKVVYQPHLDSTGVPADLQIGKSWSFKYEAERKGAGQTQEVAGVGKIAAWERVALPNGAVYDAFRIEVTLAGEAPNRRKLETRSVMWFAPAVNRLVKRTDETRVGGKLRDASEQTLREYKPAAKT